eukprot:5587880-Amphidinium_carterae.1
MWIKTVEKAATWTSTLNAEGSKSSTELKSCDPHLLLAGLEQLSLWRARLGGRLELKESDHCDCFVKHRAPKEFK